MQLRLSFVFPLIAAVLCTPPADAQNNQTDPVDFVSQIRPILSDKCFKCHGPDATHREADLRFDLEQAAKADLGGYRAISPGRAADSELVARINAEVPDERMPPVDSGKELSRVEIDLLTRWIEQGADWQTHWAYVEPIARPIPQVQNAQWPDNWIDRFVLAKIAKSGLQPAPDAERRTLIRRIYFDLIGLPPTPAAVDSFVNDPSPDAFEKIVDQLLASEHFGERLAIYWLDLVRYADTVGYHGDQDHHISPYRDWVIDAFNQNMPFDQFTREQLAGDLLPGSTVDQEIAAAYNRLLQTSHEGGVQPGEYLAIYAADRVRNLSAVWMGATMGCAQCHDHKYDPYTTRDFYSMAAFFADIDDATHLTSGVDAVPTKRLPEVKVLTRRERAVMAGIQNEMSRLQQKLLEGDGIEDSVQSRIEALSAELKRIEAAQRTIMLTRALAEARETRVLPRGNWLDPSGEVVLPSVPHFMAPLGSRRPRATRLDLANWLTNSQSGAGKLTARVFANRFWYLFFGSGLSTDLADFGGQGSPPSHSELLDQLALEFVDSSWDIKRLIRSIVTSRTYRQSSVPDADQRAIDPENKLFCRQNRFRLPGEIIRDSALAISGLLVRDIGGASIKPYQPAGYYRHLNFPQREYVPDLKAPKQWRRGLYVHWQRQFLQPMLKAFDAPMREECTARRPQSNTPTAALALLNDPTFLEAARQFAGRIIHQGGESFDERLRHAFALATSREPQGSETSILRELYDDHLKRFQMNPKSATEALEIGIAPVPDVDQAEHAAWMSVARVILNLNETIMRN